MTKSDESLVQEKLMYIHLTEKGSKLHVCCTSLFFFSFLVGDGVWTGIFVNAFPYLLDYHDCHHSQVILGLQLIPLHLMTQFINVKLKHQRNMLFEDCKNHTENAKIFFSGNLISDPEIWQVKILNWNLSKSSILEYILQFAHANETHQALGTFILVGFSLGFLCIFCILKPMF